MEFSKHHQSQTLKHGKKIFNTVVIALKIVFSTSEYIEHRYYHENQHHNPEIWHYHAPGSGVDIDIHN